MGYRFKLSTRIFRGREKHGKDPLKVNRENERRKERERERERERKRERALEATDSEEGGSHLLWILLTQLSSARLGSVRLGPHMTPHLVR